MKEETLKRLLASAATLLYLGVTAATSPSPSPSHLDPIKSPAAAYFNVTVAPRRVKAGDDAAITVTLRVDDRPASGAAVRLAMLFTPGADYRFVSASGLTDAQGVFRATLKTSKIPGESVIAATSGVFSDQGQVLGSGPRLGSVTPAPAPLRDLVPLLALVLLAAGLLLAGYRLRRRQQE